MLFGRMKILFDVTARVWCFFFLAQTTHYNVHAFCVDSQKPLLTKQQQLFRQVKIEGMHFHIKIQLSYSLSTTL